MEPVEAVAGDAPCPWVSWYLVICPQVQQRQLTQLLEQYQDIFSQDDEKIGQTPVLEHTIRTRGPLVWLPYHRQNLTVWQEEAEQLQQMLDNGIIRPSSSPWASSVVMVSEKDGRLRFYGDFRQLNSTTVKDEHPMPCIDDLLVALHGACCFSMLDLKSGYRQVPIRKADKHKTRCFGLV